MARKVETEDQRRLRELQEENEILTSMVNSTEQFYMGMKTQYFFIFSIAMLVVCLVFLLVKEIFGRDPINMYELSLFLGGGILYCILALVTFAIARRSNLEMQAKIGEHGAEFKAKLDEFKAKKR